MKFCVTLFVERFRRRTFCRHHVIDIGTRLVTCWRNSITWTGIVSDGGVRVSRPRDWCGVEITWFLSCFYHVIGWYTDHVTLTISAALHSITWLVRSNIRSRGRKHESYTISKVPWHQWRHNRPLRRLSCNLWPSDICLCLFCVR